MQILVRRVGATPLALGLAGACSSQPDSEIDKDLIAAHRPDSAVDTSSGPDAGKAPVGAGRPDHAIDASRPDGAIDAGSAQCSYPDAGNDPRCPATYYYGFSRKPCPELGLVCSYPGSGDGRADGCWGTAGLSCRPRNELDTAADAGGPTWIGVQ